MIPLPDLHLAFGDFVLLSILLTIMYGLTMVERLVASSGRAAAGTALDDRKQAGTWAYVGIIATLLAGFAASIPSLAPFQSLFLLAPALFVGRWWHHHQRISGVIQIELIATAADRYYERILLETIGNSTVPVSARDAFTRAIERVNPGRVMDMVSKHAVFRVMPVSVRSLLEGCMLTHEKARLLLTNLQNTGQIVDVGDGYVRGGAIIDPTDPKALG